MSTDDSARARSAERGFRVFAALWATAVLFELARAHGASGGLVGLLAVLFARCAALWMLARPGRTVRLLVLCTALVAAYAIRLPKGPNHGIFFMLASATVLLAALRLRLAGASATPARLYAVFAPCLRWELLALYFWAAFHKLNADFFTPDISCGPIQLQNVQRLLPFLPGGAALEPFSIYGTLAVESGIPVLLVFRRTRLAGIALALGFHLVLGARYTGFSAMLFALLSLFAPPPLLAALAARLQPVARVLARAPQTARRVAAGVDRAWGALVLGLGAALVLVPALFPDARVGHTGPPRLSHDALLGLWLAVGAALLVLFTLSAWRAGPLQPAPRGVYRLPYTSLALLPLLAFANGLAPHVGLKNVQVYAMFSNLHTGGGRTNHLLIPASWQVFDVMNDLVTIRASSDPVLDKLVGPSFKSFNYYSTVVLGRERIPPFHDRPVWRLPYAALRRRVHDLARRGERDVSLTYERGGEVRRLTDATADPELARGRWWDRLLLLRAIPDTDRGYCMW